MVYARGEKGRKYRNDGSVPSLAVSAGKRMICSGSPMAPMMAAASPTRDVLRPKPPVKWKGREKEDVVAACGVGIRRKVSALKAEMCRARRK